MRFSYRLIKDARGFMAECIEVDVAGEGKSVRDAVESLRGSLLERMSRADAIAPPAEGIVPIIDLVLTEDGQSDKPAIDDARAYA